MDITMSLKLTHSHTHTHTHLGILCASASTVMGVLTIGRRKCVSRGALDDGAGGRFKKGKCHRLELDHFVVL